MGIINKPKQSCKLETDIATRLQTRLLPRCVYVYAFLHVYVFELLCAICLCAQLLCVSASTHMGCDLLR